MSDGFTVGDYLLTRLAEIGIRHVFGVPGDYNLVFLDRLLDRGEMEWVGTANELNAAYAADGYARIAGVGALVTAYGVGELSALNGVAGSYAEYVPLIHIVGAPSTAAQRSGALMHHTLGDGDFGHFARAQAEVTVAQASLTADNAAAEIDRVIAVSLRERRPGYLLMPTDVASAPAERPSGPLVVPPPDQSASVLADFTSAVRTMLSDAGSVAVLADFLADRFGVKHEVADLVAAGQIPHATLSMGKSLLDENDPGFVGVYCGSASDNRVLKAVEGSDVTISVGVRFSDIPSNGFTQHIDPARTIDVQPFSARIGDRVFGPLPMRDAVTALTGVVRELGRSWAKPELSLVPEKSVPEDDASGWAWLTHADLWPMMERFLRPGDIVLCDQGTAFFGAQFMRLPTGVTFIGQPLWASIGYTLPATLGAQLAAPDRRVILLIGDGALQLTVQELGTLVRQGCAPVIFVLNNNGYTIERAIFGAKQGYNDIAGWNWTLLPAAMGGASARTAQVSTPNDLASALNRAALADGRLMLLDVRLPELDVPEFLATFARIAAAASIPSQAA